MIGKRGSAGFFLVLLVLALGLGACTSQGTRDALSFFGLSRKPAVARTTEPPKPPPPAPVAPAEEEEPVPVAAPRIPVETDGVTPPPGVVPRSSAPSFPGSTPTNRARPRS